MEWQDYSHSDITLGLLYLLSVYIYNIHRKSIISPPEDHRARICALGFIVRLADRLQAIRPYVAQSSGVPFVFGQIVELMRRLKTTIKTDGPNIGDTISTIRRWYHLLDLVSSYTWGIEILMQCEIAAFLDELQYVLQYIYPMRINSTR